MNEQQFKERTKRLGLNVMRLVETLPRTRTAEVVGRQLLRAATSVGANYRAACRGRSSADVIAKLGIVEEETDESMYWMELMKESRLGASETLARLMSEAEEILAMTVASIKTMKGR